MGISLAINSAFKKSCKLMGNHFELTVVAGDEKWAYDRIDAGVSEIDRKSVV